MSDLVLAECGGGWGARKQKEEMGGQRKNEKNLTQRRRMKWQVMLEDRGKAGRGPMKKRR